MKRYTITLQRLKEYQNVKKPNKEKLEDSTIGSFSVYDNEKGEVVFECFTCENGGPSSDVVGSDKRILPRTYHLKWTESKVKLPDDFKPRCITTICPNDPAHEPRRIHIHIGNYPQDTEGCLLLNYNDNKNGTCGRSTDACRDFYAFVSKYGEVVSEGKDKGLITNFELIVKEI